MSDFIDFVVKFREQGLAAVSSRTNNVMTAVNRTLGITQRQTNTTTTSIAEMNRQLDALTARRDISVDTRQIEAANREIHDLERNIQRLSGAGSPMASGGGGKKGGFWGTSGAMMMGNLAARGVSAASSFAINEGKEVLNTGMEGSMIKAQFQAMDGDKAGGKLYNDLTKYIQDSIFGNELYKGAAELNSFGVAVKDLLPDLKMLGDVSMGNKARMEAQELAFSQVEAAKKMQGQDLNQFINAGFNPLQVLAEKHNKSQEYYRDLMSEGKFTNTMLLEAYQTATGVGGKFHGMLDRISQTPYGKKAAMEGNIDNAKLQLGTALLPAMSHTMDALKPVIDGLPALMDRLTPSAERLFGAFNTLLPSIMSFGSMLGGMLKPTFDLFTSPSVVHLASNLLGLATTVGTLLVPVLTEMASQSKVLADTFGGLVGMIKGIIEWADSHGITKAAGWVYDHTPMGYGMKKLGQFNDLMGWSNHEPATANGSFKKMFGVGKMWDPREAVNALRQAQGDSHDAKLAAAVDDGGAKITGGGNRQIIINMNAPMIKDQVFHVASMSEAKEYSYETQQDILLRLLQAAKRAI